MINQTEHQYKPLLELTQFGIDIYSNCIIQHNVKNTIQIKTAQTMQIEASNDKKINLNNKYLAFEIKQESNHIIIWDLIKNVILIQFKLQSSSKMNMICQIGFYEKYQILQELGKGATAKVYLIRRKKDQKLLAAKCIKSKIQNTKQYISFINETKILKAIKHPNIVAFQSLYICNNELIEVMEYLSGGNLLKQVQKNSQEYRENKWKIIKDILQGIQHLRQKRIVHRDLKLENIMIRINKNCSKSYVLTDFGLSTWIGDNQILYEKCGTPGYIAPEILRAPKGIYIISHSSDIFSFGVIVFTILMQQSLFPYNGNTKQLLAANKKGKFTLQTKYSYLLNSSEIKFIEVCLNINATKRPTSSQLLNLYLTNINLGQKGKHKQKEKPIVTERNNLHLNNSVEVKQSKEPSLKKLQLSIEIRNKKKSNQSLQSNFIQKIFKNFSSSKEKTQKSQQMKIKNSSDHQRKDMFSFLQ